MVTLRDQIITGLKWSAVGKLGSQLFSWAVTIAVIRLLSPADYGLMAIIALIIAFLSHANELGLGAALVQSREIDDERAGTVFGAMLLLGTALSLILAAAGPAIAAFYDEPRLALLVAVAGLQFIVNAVVVVPESMLRRTMNFKRLALAELIGAVTTSLTTLVLAVAGQGVWALVLGNLSGAVVRVLVIIALNSHHVRPNLRLQSIRTLLGFGGYMTGTRFAWYFMSQADVLLASKLLGKETLGLYSVSIHLASLPMMKAMGIVNQVAFSAISRAQDHTLTVLTGLGQLLRLLAYVCLPVFVGLAALAPDFIPLVLGEKWAGAVLPLQLVSLAVPLRMLNAVLSTAVAGMGRADVDFRNTLTGLVVMPICFLIGLEWGAVGLAASWLVGVPCVFALNYRRTVAVVGLTIQRMFLLIVRPVFATTLMALVLVLGRQFMTDWSSGWGRLLTMIFVGSTIYVTCAFLIDSQLRREIRSAVS